MDRKAAIGAAVAIPFLAIVCWYLTSHFTPIWGYFGTLAFYWLVVLTPLMIWRGTDLRQLQLGLPSRGLIGLVFLPVAIVAIVASMAFAANPLPLWVVGAVVLIAICNGTLEELFWRGTVQKNGATVRGIALGVALFTSWHFALLTAQNVHVTGGALGLLGGAAMGGALWAYARAKTGRSGLGALGHIGLNIFAFLELTTHNLPGA